MKPVPVRQTFVEKLDHIRKELAMRFPEMDMRLLCETLRKIAHNQYKKEKGMLLGETKELYNFLIEKGYNPYTIYRWLLLERIPDDIRFQIKQGKISQKNAVSEAHVRKQETVQELGDSIRQAGLNLIRRM